MKTDIGIIPSAEDRPSSRMGGTAGDIPILYLETYGDVRIQFRANKLAETAVYLDRLIEAAAKLRVEISKALETAEAAR